jgi:prepilin-type N-terminal cleavage/methylation domain-containing protein
VSRTRPSRAFTLLEVTVVVVIIALLTTMVVPKLTGATRRSFDLAVDRVDDLLVMLAYRDGFEDRPIGIHFDDNEDAPALQLLVLDEEVDGGGWRLDRSVEPARLTEAVDPASIVVYADGEPVDVRDWPLSYRPGEDRPRIEIEMRSVDQEHFARLVLDPHALAPRRADGPQLAQRFDDDLDSSGRSREDW